MLRALGMTNGAIVKLFFIETGMIGFIGAAAGLLLFLSLFVYHGLQFGSQWELGRYGMPRSLVNETGYQYLDGTEIDPLTLALIKNDHEEGVHLFLLGVLLVLGLGNIGMAIWFAWRRRRMLTQLRKDYRRKLEEEGKPLGPFADA